MYEIKYEDFYTDFSSDKEMLDLKEMLNKNYVATTSHNEYRDVLLDKNFWDIQWIIFRVKILEEKLMKSAEFLYLTLIINIDTKQRMWWISSWLVELTVKRQLMAIQKTFFVKHIKFGKLKTSKYW